MDYELMINGNVKIGQQAPDFIAESTYGTVSLDDYKLKWISKVIDMTPVPKKDGGDKKEGKDIVLTIPCPNCKKEINFSKKELLK